MKIISKIIGNKEYQYSVYKRKKANGKFRIITAPDQELKSLQREYALAFYEKVKDEMNSAEVTGFMPGVSIMDNARVHVGKRWVVNLDIQSFFPSTNRDLVQMALDESKLECDRDMVLEILTLNNALPQGSPASPVISNYVATKLVDPLVKQVMDKHGLQYKFTRYADDLTLSFDEDLKREQIISIVNEIIEYIELKTPYIIAKNKVKIRSSSYRQEVTGIVVNSGSSMKREDYKRLRAELHAISLGRKEMTSVLKGKLNFLRDISPQKFEKLTKGFLC
ncbi:MAG: reverse transcriptase family protein [Lachnospiraceae bacterium]|nr:reverse transcriptase family protein [Lachnospiraceae bacterium]